jgi:hypothetical protein
VGVLVVDRNRSRGLNSVPALYLDQVYSIKLIDSGKEERKG